jgi:hypothetical protein
MRELQDSGVMTIRVERAQNGGAATLLALAAENPAAPGAGASRELRELLGMDPGRSEFSLVFGRNSTAADEIAVQSRSLLNILQIMSSSPDQPDASYVTVRYRDMWFYVDDTDYRSKRAFSVIMLLFTLADSSADRATPVITIPAQ